MRVLYGAAGPFPPKAAYTRAYISSEAGFTRNRDGTAQFSFEMIPNQNQGQ